MWLMGALSPLTVTPVIRVTLVFPAMPVPAETKASMDCPVQMVDLAAPDSMETMVFPVSGVSQEGPASRAFQESQGLAPSPTLGQRVSVENPAWMDSLAAEESQVRMLCIRSFRCISDTSTLTF